MRSPPRGHYQSSDARISHDQWHGRWRRARRGARLCINLPLPPNGIYVSLASIDVLYGSMMRGLVL